MARAARPHRSLSLVRTARIWASMSTCSRLHVGCVLEREGRILVQGYNGAPAGLPHCDHRCNCSRGWPEHNSSCAEVAPCTRAVHAEQNAISFAARWGVSLEGSSAWVTHQPCVSCAQSLINAGVKGVSFVEPYRLTAGVELLAEAGIEVYNLGLIHGLEYGRVDL